MDLSAMDWQAVVKNIDAAWEQMLAVAIKPETYSELGLIALIYVLAYLLVSRVRKHIVVFREAPAVGSEQPLRHLAYRFGKLLFPLFAIVGLRLSLEITSLGLVNGWLMNTALTVAMLLLFNSFINLAVVLAWTSIE